MAFGVACPQMYFSVDNTYSLPPLETLEMGQVEDTQRLAHYLETHVAGAMIACSVECADALQVGCRQRLPVEVTVQRHEFVTFKAPVHVDVQFHVFLSDGGDAKSELKAVIAHLTQIGQ